MKFVTKITAFFLCSVLLFLGLVLLSQKTSALDPGAPEGLTAFSNGSREILLSWTAVEGAEGYEVFRLTEGQTYQSLGTTSVSEFQDRTPENGVVYQYAVCALQSGTEGPLTEGVIGVTSFQVPEPYDIRITNITREGYRITAKLASDSPVTEARFPSWTEKDGQDDLVWHQGTVSGNEVTCFIPAAEHGGQGGRYITHIYLTAADGSKNPAPYCCSADVPEDGNGHLSAPVVRNVTPSGFDVSMLFTSVSGILRVRTAVWTEDEEMADAEWNTAEVSEGILNFHVDTASHGGTAGIYRCRVYLYDLEGKCDVCSFSVLVPEEEGSELLLVAVHQEHGDVTILQAGEETWLIDAGRSDEASETIRVLQELQVEHFNVLITHSHSDHFAGLFPISEQFTVDRVYMNDEISTAYEDETSRKMLLQLLAERSIPVQPLSELASPVTIGNAVLEIIGPDRYYDLSVDGTTNDNSCWIRITEGTQKILLAGDAEKIVEQDMIASGTDLSADVVKVSHHGGRSSTGDEFAAAVSAKLAFIEGGVLSIAPEGTEVRSNLQKYGTEVLSVEETGTLSILFSENGFTPCYHVSSPVNAADITEDPFVLYGDVNGDNVWDARDTAFMVNHILKKITLEGKHLEAADVNGDGEIDARDLAFVTACILGKISEVPQRR